MKQKFFAPAAVLLLAAALAACGGEKEANETNGETIATDTAATAPVDTTATDTTASQSAQLDQASRDFASNAAMAGMAEVMMGQLGQQKAQNADVRAFAEKMVSEHSTNNEQLQQIATAKGITPPTELDATHKAAMDHLQMLSGAEFDKAFMMHMVDDHQKAVDLFTSAQNLTDAELKAYATSTLPTLQQHLQAAKDTQAKLK